MNIAESGKQLAVSPEAGMPAKQLLADLVRAQHAEFSSLGLDNIGLYSGSGLMQWFKESLLLEDAYKEGIPEFTMPRTEQDLDKLRDRFAGRIFGDMAYAYLAQRIGGRSILFSPENTRKLWFDGFFPNPDKYPRIKEAFGQTSIAGISVPDGIAVTEVNGEFKITGIYEYKTGGNDYDRSYTVEDKRADSPALFHHPRLVLVTPNGSYLANEVRDSKDIDEIIFMPFPNVELRSFVSNLYSYSPNGESASLADFQERAREQSTRFSGLRDSRDARFTDEMRDYLSRVNTKSVLRTADRIGRPNKTNLHK